MTDSRLRICWQQGEMTFVPGVDVGGQLHRQCCRVVCAIGTRDPLRLVLSGRSPATNVCAIGIGGFLNSAFTRRPMPVVDIRGSIPKWRELNRSMFDSNGNRAGRALLLRVSAVRSRGQWRRRGLEIADLIGGSTVPATHPMWVSERELRTTGGAIATGSTRSDPGAGGLAMNAVRQARTILRASYVSSWRRKRQIFSWHRDGDHEAHCGGANLGKSLMQ
jgi:hypothetical protein